MIHIKFKTTHRGEGRDPDVCGPLVSYVGFADNFTYIVCGARTSEEEAQTLFPNGVRSATAFTMIAQTRYFAVWTTIMSAARLT